MFAPKQTKQNHLSIGHNIVKFKLSAFESRTPPSNTYWIFSPKYQEEKSTWQFFVTFFWMEVFRDPKSKDVGDHYLGDKKITK